MAKLIIVCGMPGSGKTTLASELSNKLKIVCLHKDSVKEKLYESMKMNSLEESKKIGKPSVDIILQLAEEQLKNGIDIIIEAPFSFQEDYVLFEEWKEKYNLSIYSVLCKIEDDIRKERFTSRPRHGAHHDSERDFTNMLSSEAYPFLPGKQIMVKTDRPTEDLARGVIEQLV